MRRYHGAHEEYGADAVALCSGSRGDHALLVELLLQAGASATASGGVPLVAAALEGHVQVCVGGGGPRRHVLVGRPGGGAGGVYVCGGVCGNGGGKKKNTSSHLRNLKPQTF